MLSIFKNFMSFLKDNKTKDKEVKNIRDLIPLNFIEYVFDFILQKDIPLKYQMIDNMQIINCYFCGATLCIDVEFSFNKEIRRDIITITSDNTFGFFVTECKRDKLSIQEIEKIDKIRLAKNK